MCIAWRKALKVIWNLPYANNTPLHVQLKARFVKFIAKALNHNNSIIKSITKYVCNNTMSVWGRNWSGFVYVVTESVKEIYNEWYGLVDVKEMDTVSVLNDMIDVRVGGVLVLFQTQKMLIL